MIITKDIQTALKKATPRQLLDTLILQNPDLMVEYVAKNRRDDCIQMFLFREQKPIGFEQLELRFVDSQSHMYYGYPKDFSIPMPRYGKIRDFEMWMTVGVTPAEIEQILDAMDVAWVNSLKSKKNHHELGALIQELRMRSHMVVHTELLFNYLACQWIRDDESPDTFDPTIHDEKVATFKKESDNGRNHFFFVQPELKRWNELYNFTPIEWEHYWNESNLKRRHLQNLANYIVSGKGYKKETTTSTPE